MTTSAQPPSQRHADQIDHADFGRVLLLRSCDEQIGPLQVTMRHASAVHMPDESCDLFDEGTDHSYAFLARKRYAAIQKAGQLLGVGDFQSEQITLVKEPSPAAVQDQKRSRRGQASFTQSMPVDPLPQGRRLPH